MPSSLAPLLWFAAIIALIPFALWLLKRTPIGAAGAPGGLRNVGSLALSPSQRVVTVEVGHGEQRRWLVLGVTAQNIALLHDMAPQGDATPAAVATAAPFARQLWRNGWTGRFGNQLWNSRSALWRSDQSNLSRQRRLSSRRWTLAIEGSGAPPRWRRHRHRSYCGRQQCRRERRRRVD